MIDFSDNTYKKLLTLLLSRVTESIDKREGSLIQTALGPVAYALEEAYLDLMRIQMDAYTLTATGKALDNKVAEVGLTRKLATPAVRLGLFNIDIPIGARFYTKNGADSISFYATERLAFGQFKLTCEQPGQIGNTYSGELVAVTYIKGLTNAELTDIIIPGDDEEADGALVSRYKESLNNKPFGGNVASYKTAIMAMDGVGGVQIYPTWNGGGTVKCSIVGADFLPASNKLLQSVQAAIDPVPYPGAGIGLAPIGAKVTISTPEVLQVNITANITTKAGYTLEQIKTDLLTAIEKYIKSVRHEWPEPIITGTTQYSVVIYRSQIISALSNVKGVVNAKDIEINGQDEDLELTQAGEIQYLPILGELSLFGN